jgi:hypothetical protein
MTIKACNTRILVGGVDLSGDTNTVAVNIQGRVLEYGVLQDCDTRKLALSPQASIEHNGYYSGPGASTIEGMLYSYLASTTGVHVGVIYDTAGTVPFGYVQDTAYNSKLNIAAQAGQLITCAGMWPTLTGSGNQMYRCYQVYGGTISATGAVTGIDFGAAGAAGGRAYVFVTAITGTATNAAVKIQSDSNSDHSTTADEGNTTFSAVGCYEIALSGTVNRYVRFNCTSLGGATNFTAYVLVGLSGVTV